MCDHGLQALHTSAKYLKQLLTHVKITLRHTSRKLSFTETIKETAIISFMSQHDQSLPYGKHAKPFDSHQARLKGPLTGGYTHPGKLS